MGMWKEERPYDCSPSSEEAREAEAERGGTRKKRRKKKKYTGNRRKGWNEREKKLIERRQK